MRILLTGARGQLGTDIALRLSDRDVVLLNSDTEVTAGWLDALARCAASSPHVGTITPWSNNAPRPNPLPATVRDGAVTLGEAP